MPKQRVTIVNIRGLHARAANKFAQLSGTFEAEVTVSKDGQSVGGRSIMGLLMLGAAPGTAVDIETDGSEAAPALEALVALVEGGFDEELAEP